MKKLTPHMVAFLAITTLATTGCANRLGSATVTVRVVDENGQPINGAWADFYHLNSMSSNPGFTDVNGLYSTRLENIFANISGHFTKLGYYNSNGKFWSWADSAGKELVPPANTNFVVVLKRIIEPVQMKKREITVYAPCLGEPVGFDFEIGDLVFPAGKGKHADIQFTTRRDYIADNDLTSYVTVEFLGEHDGIQSFSFPDDRDPLKSDLIPPPIAPESGYEKTLERFSKCTPPNKWTSSYVKDRKWIFRTRTVVNDDGKIVAANYGWTSTEIRVTAKPETNDEVLGITFTYYYNPDLHSRSLEPKEIADRQAKNLPKGED